MENYELLKLKKRGCNVMPIVVITCLLLAWQLLGALILGYTSKVGSEIELQRVNPLYTYKRYHVNWFGAAVVALIFNCVCPVLSFCYWFYKLCTVGRKDGN
jgi:hypothetical protein